MFLANQPRAITGPEDAILDAANQFSTFGLVVHPATVVYTALVNGTPGSYDHLAVLTYDTGVGVLANVLPGMTYWIGTTAGAFDVGTGRVRKAPDATHLYIGEVSNLKVLDDQFITIIDEMGIWPRHPFITDLAAGTINEDYDIVYSNQHTVRAPIPVMGPPAVLEFHGLEVTVPFDARDSWVPGGGVATYAWAAPGSSSSSGMATAQPIIGYNAEGTYRVACTVTIGGVSTTGYRYVYVKDPANMLTQFSFSAASGSQSAGGWSFDVTMYAGADLATIRDRAFVILWSNDYAANQRVRQGYVIGRENILTCGWIDGESIDWNPDYGQVTFSVKGPRQWIGITQAFLLGLYNTTTTPDRWILYNGLNFQAALWHLLFWRSTLATMLDCLVEPNLWLGQEFTVPANNLWEQLVAFSDTAIKAAPLCDRYGRLFVIKDSQFQIDRSGYPTVLTLDSADWTPMLTIKRDPTDNVSMVYFNGASLSGATPTSYFALSPGHTYAQYGTEQRIEGQILPDQATALHMAGLMLGFGSNDYPSIQPLLAQNNRWLDIAPPMYVALVVTPGDTVRGLALNIRTIPRSVGYAWDAQTGVVTTKLDLEAETFELNSAIGDPPQLPPGPPPPSTVCPAGQHPDPVTGACVADVPPVPGQGDGQHVTVATNVALGRTVNFGAGNNWVSVGPTLVGGETIQDVLFDPYDPAQTVYMLTTKNLYKTTNYHPAGGGLPAWTNVLTLAAASTAVGGTGLYALMRIESTITAPGLIGVIGVMQGGSFTGYLHTHDGGATWFGYGSIPLTSPNPTVQTVGFQMSQYDANKVWVCGGASNVAKVYASTDGGHTFSAMAGTPGFYNAYCIHIPYAGNPNDLIGYVAGDGTEGFLYKTTDGFATLVDISPTLVHGAYADGAADSHKPAARILLVPVTDANRIFMLGSRDYGFRPAEGAHVLLSKDGGATWQNNHNFSASDPQVSVNCIGAWPWLDSSRLYAVGNAPDPQIAYSTDEGVTWNDMIGDWGSAIGGFGTGVNIIPTWVPV